MLCSLRPHRLARDTRLAHGSRASFVPAIVVCWSVGLIGWCDVGRPSGAGGGPGVLNEEVGALGSSPHQTVSIQAFSVEPSHRSSGWPRLLLIN